MTSVGPGPVPLLLLLPPATTSRAFEIARGGSRGMARSDPQNDLCGPWTGSLALTFASSNNISGLRICYGEGGVQGKGTECPPKQPLWALDLCPAHAPILDTLCSLFVFPSPSPVLLAVFDPSFLSVCLCPSSGPNSVSSDFRSHDWGVFIIFIITLTNAGRSLQEIPVTATAPNYRDFSPPGGVGAYRGWASPLLGDRPCPGLWL